MGTIIKNRQTYKEEECRWAFNKNNEGQQRKE
jgi:hypothetical protein